LQTDYLISCSWGKGDIGGGGGDFAEECSKLLFSGAIEKNKNISTGFFE
jgi:hypothetical protein